MLFLQLEAIDFQNDKQNMKKKIPKKRTFRGIKKHKHINYLHVRRQPLILITVKNHRLHEPH